MKKNIHFRLFLKLNNKAEVVNHWFGRTVIYSDQRFAYEEAQNIIETKEDTIPAEISITEKHIKFLKQLLQRL